MGTQPTLLLYLDAAVCGDTGGVESVAVSESGGTRLMIRDGRWVVASDHGVVDSEASLVPLLPLLEHKPLDAIRRVQSLGGPAFPWQALVVFALSGESTYWQEQAVRWLDALDAGPEGQLADAARHAIEHGRASQRHRQQLQRWLSGKPIRRV